MMVYNQDQSRLTWLNQTLLKKLSNLERELAQAVLRPYLDTAILPEEADSGSDDHHVIKKNFYWNITYYTPAELTLYEDVLIELVYINRYHQARAFPKTICAYSNHSHILYHVHRYDQINVNTIDDWDYWIMYKCFFDPGNVEVQERLAEIVAIEAKWGWILDNYREDRHDYFVKILDRLDFHHPDKAEICVLYPYNEEETKPIFRYLSERYSTAKRTVRVILFDYNFREKYWFLYQSGWVPMFRGKSLRCWLDHLDEELEEDSDDDDLESIESDLESSDDFDVQVRLSHFKTELQEWRRVQIPILAIVYSILLRDEYYALTKIPSAIRSFLYIVSQLPWDLQLALYERRGLGEAIGLPNDGLVFAFLCDLIRIEDALMNQR